MRRWGSPPLSVVGRSGGLRVVRASSTESPQPLHHWCTVSTSCPHEVEDVPAGARLWCRAMSQTPTYDQVRGERINADVPASEADPHELDDPGKHRLRADTPIAAEVCGPSPGPGAELAEDWSGFATGDSELLGKHCLRADLPAATAVCGPLPGPGADLVGGWSWFGTGALGRADSANATRPVHCSGETPGHGHTPAANQQPGADRRGLSDQVPHPPPSVHARHRQQPGCSSAGCEAKAGPLTVSEPAEPDHDSQSLDPSPSASVSGQ